MNKPGDTGLTEAQDIYLFRDLLEFVPRHQWPECQLPVPQAVPQPEAPTPSVNEELLKGLQTTHDAAVNMLHTQGIDACKVYREKELQPSWLTSDPKMSDVPTVKGSAKHLRN